MENPHEEKQAVLLERIIKNVVSESPSPPERMSYPSPIGEMQRKHRGAQPMFRGDYPVQRSLCYVGPFSKLLA